MRCKREANLLNQPNHSAAAIHKVMAAFPRLKPPGNLEPIPQPDTTADFRDMLHTAKRMISQ